MTEAKIRFDPGRVVMTPGAMEAIASAGRKPSDFLLRHVSGDWGDFDTHDSRANESALHDNLRILSAYNLTTGVAVWVITEHDRSVTTILLPSEY